LINLHLSNLNRVLESTPPRTYLSKTIAQTDAGYFSLISTLALPNYTANPIATSITNVTTSPLCSLVSCSIQPSSPQSLQDIAQTFRQRFDYWNPSNLVTPTATTINRWLSDNSIAAILEETVQVLQLVQTVQGQVGSAFASYTGWEWEMGVWLIVVLIPVNVLALGLILRRYLNVVNKMVHTAEELFMHFPVSVLIENTYLTSYFNAKSKNGK
jgi:hypothetical protein